MGGKLSKFGPMPAGVEELLASIRNLDPATPPPSADALAELGRAPVAYAELPIAVEVAQLMCSLVRDGAQVGDEPMASLINSGGLEAALRLYAHHGPRPADSTELGELVHELIDAASEVALLQHSGEALRQRWLNLRETAVCLSEAGAEYSAVELLSLLHHADPTLRAALPAEALDCCRGCGQTARAAELKRCAKCATPYCSRECQVQDWKNGHKLLCKRVASGEAA